MVTSLRRMSRAEPASWLRTSCTLAERSTLDRASATSPFYLGQPFHPSRGQNRYPSVAADRGGMPAFQGSTSHPPPRQVNAVVRRHCTLLAVHDHVLAYLHPWSAA